MSFKLPNVGKKVSESWGTGPLTGADEEIARLGRFRGPNVTNYANKAWSRSKMPEFYGSRMEAGGYDNYNLLDPRLLLYGPLLGAPVAAIQQTELQRQNRELEKQYMPIAERNAGIAAQNANYGGTQGGSGTASAQTAFEEVLAQLIAAKRQAKQQQMAQEMQAVSALMSVLGYAAGGPPGAMLGSGLGQMGTNYMYGPNASGTGE